MEISTLWERLDGEEKQVCFPSLFCLYFWFHVVVVVCLLSAHKLILCSRMCVCSVVEGGKEETSRDLGENK